jgi:hypothetical protein
MRLLPLLALAACFDGATTTVTLDVKQGTARVVQHLHNAWPDEVGCAEVDGALPSVETCLGGIRARLEKKRAELAEGGATVARSGVVLAGGELDFLYDYTAPVGADTMTEEGLAFMWMDARTPRQVEAGRAGKRRLAMVSLPISGGTNEVEVDGRYRRLTGGLGEDDLDIWLFSGRAATIVSEWTYTREGDGPQSPGAWLSTRPGLEEAIRGSGLVIEP